MEKDIVEIVKAFVQPILDAEGSIFLVDIIKKSKSSAGGKLIVLLDGDKGISIEKCVEISRALSHYIDEEVNLTEPLTLEVSSAGLDHPLKLRRQYFKNIGKSVRVTQVDQSEITGVLKSVSDDNIIIEKPASKKKVAEEIEIDFENINKTIVLVSFKKKNG